MKKVVIVHGWKGFPENCWYPKTKKELEEKGYKVSVPQMPDVNHPKLSLWLKKLKEIAGDPDEDLFLVGHSLGCITILRYLENLSENQKVGGVIFVAGFAEDLGKGYEIIKSFFEKPIGFDKLKNKSKYYTGFYSDNDDRVPEKFGNVFKQKLGTKIIILHNMDHFSNKKRIISSFPELTDEFLSMSNYFKGGRNK